ncbi:MAG: hypothetical protein RIQ60_2370 [Pseudomonadota bacterium]
MARPGSAVSTEARQVRACAEAMVDRVERSDVLFGNKTALISQLWGLTRSHAEAGWDGGEAMPADRHAIQLAATFVRVLPDACELPELGVDPDGAITLDWMASRQRMLSISFSGQSDRLAYAWIDGTDRGHGVVKFDRDSVPMRLMQAILAATVTPDHVALRAA